MDDYGKPHKLGSNYDILTHSPRTPLEKQITIWDSSAHLLPPYIPLLPGYVTQDVYRKNAGQDNLENFSAPAVNILNTKEALW